MSTQKIAQFVLERSRRAVPLIQTGEALQAIGSDGLKEALDKRWLVTDHDSYWLRTTLDHTRLQEVHAAAATPDAEAQVHESQTARIVLEHANRPVFEISAPGTGKPGPALTSAPAAPPTPTSPPASQQPMGSGAPAKTLGIGSDVTVAENGRSYTGKVSGRTPEGRYRLNFGGERPASVRDYAPDEMQVQ
jgi:hypothetical protein